MHLEDRLALYKYLQPGYNRQPTFLARNLRRILAAHEVECQRHKAHQRTDDETACPTEDEHVNRISWKPPSLTMVNKAKKERLFITRIKELKPANYDGGDEYSTAKEILLRCEIQIGIALSNSKSEQKVSCPPQSASLEIRRIGTRIRASIKTRGGNFTIPIHDILKLVSASCVAIELDITISLLGDNYQLREVYKFLGLGNVYAPPRQLHAFHPNILDLDALPPESLISVDGRHDYTIPLQYKSSGELNGLGCSLKASLSWGTCDTYSIFGAVNRKTRPRTKLPSTSVVKQHGLEKIWNVQWKISNHRILRDDLRCVFCDQKHFNTVKELHLHLTTHHYHFEYHVSNTVTHIDMERWSIDCDLSVTQTHSQTPEQQHEVQVLRPQRPFNIEEHLQGDASWSREAALEDEVEPDEPEQSPLLSRQVPDLQLRQKERWPVPAAPDKVKFYRRRNKRRLEEGELVSESDDDVDTEWSSMARARDIMQLPITEPQKRFIIKWDEHVRKERLNSDKHLKDSVVRFVRLHGEWLCRQNLGGEFRQKIDELLEDHLLTREFYDYCIQSLSKTATDIAEHEEDGITPEGSPLNGTFSAGLIEASTMETRRRSPRKIDKGKAKAKGEDKIIEYARRMDLEGNIEMLDAEPTGQRETVTAKKTAPLDACLCGEDALNNLGSLRKLINCTNELCEQPIFHLSCVLQHWDNIERRGRRRVSPRENAAWLCRVCENGG